MRSLRMLIIMAQRIGLVGLVLPFGVLSTMVPAQSEVITFQLQVVTTYGGSSTGTFAIDSNIIPPGGGQVVSPSFTDMDFTWEEWHYTAGFSTEPHTRQIETSFLTFDSAGNLVAWSFGTSCSPPGDGGCELLLLPPGVVPPNVGRCCSAWLVNTLDFRYGHNTLDVGSGTATVTRLTPSPPIPPTPPVPTLSDAGQIILALLLLMSAVWSLRRLRAGRVPPAQT